MKSKIYFRSLLLVTLSLWLYSCAKTGSLSGGIKDTVPPQLVVKKSTPNYLVNFSQSKVILHFDEFITLKNLSQNILISPPMIHVPEIKQRGKKITIHFNEKEILREDATYSIDFGKSIVDFTEGNVLEDFKYVFATGDVIDSLTLSGSVVDAFDSEKEVGEVYLLLYDVLTDSIVAQERPFYVVRTKEDGSFKLENLRSDTFKIIALDDKNFNLIYDLDSERIGYQDQTIILTDSTTVTPIIKLFGSEEKLDIVSKNTRTYGLISHIMSTPVDSTTRLNIYHPESIQLLEERNRDTVRLWYTTTPDSLNYSLGTDTLSVYPPVRDSIFDKKKVKVSLGKNIFSPWAGINVTASAPIAVLDTSLISMYETIKQRPKRDFSVIDSTIIGEQQILDTLIAIDTLSEPLLIDTTILDTLVADTLVLIDTVFADFQPEFNIRTLTMNSAWKTKQPYTLSFLPGAITDIYGRTTDTLSLTFAIKGTLDFGNVTVQIDALNDTLNYVLRLMSKDEEYDKYIVKQSKTATAMWSRVPVGTYSLQLIEDLDGDGKWSTGDYWSKKQPEKIKREELQPLQVGWDLEGTISWKVSSTMIEQDSTNIETPTDTLDQKKSIIDQRK